MKDKNQRKKEVLNIIIKAYIKTGEPVGSGYVSGRLNLSSATIRNVMGELEAEGLISQPHTSAGRVPTERSYRRYVNSIIGSLPYEDLVDEELWDAYFANIKHSVDLAEYISHVISTITRYTSFTVTPDEKFYVDGTHHILEYPEFRDIEMLRMILRVLEEKGRMLDVLGRYFSEGDVSVHIGRENPFGTFKSMSVVAAPYKKKKNMKGGLGVIGPMRMPYEKVIPVLELLSDYAVRLFEESSEQEEQQG